MNSKQAYGRLKRLHKWSGQILESTDNLDAVAPETRAWLCVSMRAIWLELLSLKDVKIAEVDHGAE